MPAPIDVNESLAEAVCCDKRALPFAEPQFLYKQPDVGLFRHVTKTTTFYDSVCGLPLFRAPVNRTLNDFKADTDEHGWPSFRAAEVFAENVRVADGLVTSACGTHLGTYLPDDKGPRWCIDLACVAGHRALNATLSTDKCGGVDAKSYLTPLDVCYSPPALFQDDPQWGVVRRPRLDTAPHEAAAPRVLRHEGRVLRRGDGPLRCSAGPVRRAVWKTAALGEFSLVDAAAMASVVA